jgi:DNA-binding CsgD family transcriptional regulator
MEDSQGFTTQPASPAEFRTAQPNVALMAGHDWLYVQAHYGLTDRERQIAEMVCQGFRNDLIAGSLRIRPGTVKTHLRNIYRKVRVKSKLAMLLRFVSEAKRNGSPACDPPPLQIPHAT